MPQFKIEAWTTPLRWCPGKSDTLFLPDKTADLGKIFLSKGIDRIKIAIVAQDDHVTKAADPVTAINDAPGGGGENGSAKRGGDL